MTFESIRDALMISAGDAADTEEGRAIDEFFGARCEACSLSITGFDK